ncbi:MAG: type II secretion system GspH family protein [Candidatus Nomurabacteria bacterium]|nr:type II secretion system GspH family protein [Candidatus Nomurabacteria bacterium]
MKAKKGFTIIELTLAMTFVSILLITVFILVMQITKIYTKGTSIKEVNSVGRSLLSDFNQTIGASPVKPGLGTDGNKYFMIDAAKAGGRFCTGSYSYIWNNGKTLTDIRDGVANVKANMFKTSSSNVPVRLLKVSDSSRTYCNSGDDVVTIDGSKINATELISSNESEVAIYDLFVYKPIIDDSANASGQALYTLSFVLGTLGNNVGEGGLIDGNNQCKAPSDAGSDFNYCAINKFDLSTRAMGSN